MAEQNPPQLVLFGGKFKYLDVAMEKKIIVAAVTVKPGVDFKHTKPPNLLDLDSTECGFPACFLYIDMNNLYQMRKDYPLLFK